MDIHGYTWINMDIHNLKKVFPLTVQNLFKHRQKHKQKTRTSSSYSVKEKTGITFNRGFVLRFENGRNNIQQEDLAFGFYLFNNFSHSRARDGFDYPESLCQNR